MKLKNFLTQVFFLAILLIVNHNANAKQFSDQNSIKRVPLEDVLNEVTHHYKVKFLYEPDNIKDKVVSINDDFTKGEEISDLLLRILKPVGLSWYSTDKINYAIYPSRRIMKLEDSVKMEVNAIKDSVPQRGCSGVILDHLHKPQIFATVSLISLPDSTVINNVLTDTSGVYNFISIKPGMYVIKATNIGYKSALSSTFTIVSSGKGVKLDPIVMVQSANTLQEIKIVGKHPLVERKVDRFVVNVENSAMASGNSVQLLKSAPFVQVSQDDQVSLQGKKTLVLIDNKPYPDATIADMLRTLPAGNISKLELITNPSARYDASYGAVINIITKKNQMEGVTGNVRAEGSLGRYGQYDFNSSLTYKAKALTVYGTVGYERQNVYINSEQDRIFNNASVGSELIDKTVKRIDVDRYSFQVGADLAIGKNQTIGVLANGNIKNWHGNITSNDLFGKINAPADSNLYTNGTGRSKAHTLNFNLNYHLLADSGKTELTALATFTPYGSMLNQDFPSTLYDASGAIIRNPEVFRTTNKPNINIFVTQVDYSRSFGHQFKFEAGAKYQNTQSKSLINYDVADNGQFINVPQNSSNNKLSEEILGAYSTLSKGWSKDKIQIGLRMENTKADDYNVFSQNYTKLFPTAVYEHDFNDNYNFSLSYKRMISRVPYEELVPYTIFIDQYTVYQGNPSLKPRYDNELDFSTKLKDSYIGVTYVSSTGTFAQFPINQNFDSKITYFAVQNLDASKDIYLWIYYPLRLFSWWRMENSLSPYGHTTADGSVLQQPFKLSSSWWNGKSNNIFTLSKSVKFEVDGYYYSSYSSGLTSYRPIGNIDASLVINVLNGRGDIRLKGSDILKRNVSRSYQDFRTYTSRNTSFEDSQRIGIGFSYNFGRTKISTLNKNLGNDDAVGRIK